MRDDWYEAAIDDLEQAADDLRASLDFTMGNFATLRHEHRAGGSLLPIIQARMAGGGRTQRLAPTRAFKAWERALTAYRAQVIQELVDEDDLTFSDAAELLDISRQMVSRLYSAARAMDGDNQPE